MPIFSNRDMYESIGPRRSGLRRLLASGALILQP
jgi:hypothetical protein